MSSISVLYLCFERFLFRIFSTTIFLSYFDKILCSLVLTRSCKSCYTLRYRNPSLTSCSTSISRTRSQFRITQKNLYTSEKIHWVSKYSKSLKNLNWWLIASDLMTQCTKRLITSCDANGLFTQISSISILTCRWIVQNVRKCVNQRARASRPVG